MALSEIGFTKHKMHERASFWLWPNMAGIDAALIAIAWQWLFAASVDQNISPSAQLVLGLSVWLSYMADRLYDVRRHPMDRLLSLRHRFAKTYRKPLWSLWFIVLALDIGIAIKNLSTEQLIHGCVLLVACLLYTFLSQIYSKRFFPKELIVALIFTAGVIVFMQSLPSPLAIFCLAVTCFVNCLILGHKEQAVDRALRVQSLTSIVSTKTLWVCILTAFAILPFIEGMISFSLFLTLLATSLLYLIHKQIGSEFFRAALDASMLVGLLAYVIVTNIC